MIVHHKNRNDYLSSKKEFPTSKLKEELATKIEATAQDGVTPTTAQSDAKVEVKKNKLQKLEEKAKENLKSPLDAAKNVAKELIKTPPLPLPILAPSPLPLSKDSATVQTKDPQKTDSTLKRHLKKIEKPAVIFIEGFELFSSGGNGLKDMAENFKGATHFTWDQKSEIIEKIKSHAESQPIVLIGHSFGADSAIEIAEELNTLKNNFRPIDLVVTLDAVGFNHHVVPVNVKKNLNFFAEGRLPMLHGTAHVARNPDLTNVHNELRNENHTAIDDSRDLQFEIFHEIKKTIQHSNSSLENEKKISELDENEKIEIEIPVPTINIILMNDEKSTSEN